MNYHIIPAALITALFITAFISSFSKRPIQILSIFLLIVFLAAWAGQLWIIPFGPVTQGISWIPLMIVAITFSFIAHVLLPGKAKNKKVIKEPDDGDDEEALGFLFWTILIILVLSIIAGYFRFYYSPNTNTVAGILR
ncbi:MAG: hypothetical protein WDM71_09555 [Ferruginibacter sp.]